MDIVVMESATIERPYWLDASREVMVVVAMERVSTYSTVSLLHEAGFCSDRVEVLLVEEVPRLEERLGGSGLHRFLVRLRMVRGDDLDLLEQARRELMNGRALIQVTVNGYDEQCLALSILGVRNSGRLENAADQKDPEIVPPAGMMEMRGMSDSCNRPLRERWHPVVNEIRQDRVQITL
jgi:hypothetical protein